MSPEPGTLQSPIGWSVARRPAVLAALLFIAGIALHPYLPHRPVLWLIWLATILAAAVVCRRSPRLGSVLIALGMIVAGLATAQLQAYFYPRAHISAFAADRPRLAQLELRIDHPPRVLTNRYETHRAMPPKQVTTATVTRVKTWDGWEDANGEVLVSVNQPHPRLAVNQTVRVTGMLQRPAPANNPGQFDWAAYYREQRILASVHIPGAQNIEILSSPGPGPVAVLREEVRRLLAAGFEPERSLDHALLRALLLGDSDPEMRDVQEQFRRTGTSHHLAISGMHVAVLGGLVWWACRLLRMSPRASMWVMLGFVVLYGVVVLPSPPVVRSVLLALAFGFGLTGRRALDAVQLLALTVLAMLIYHPLDLYNPGFQLSFGTVLGLILFTRPMLTTLRATMGRATDPDERIAQQVQRRGPIAVALRWLDDVIFKALAAGFVAWGVSMPLIAYHFEQLNPWAVLAGILLAPVVFLAMIGGLLKVLLTFLWPSLAGTWAVVAGVPVRWMRLLVDRLADLPWGDVPVPPPALWVMAGFYVLLLSALVPCSRPGMLLCLRGARLTAFVLVLFLPFQTGLTRPSAFSGEVRVTLLAVGAGQCAVVEPPSGRTVLVDAGSTSLNDLLAKCLGPFLRSRGCTNVDTVLVSHANFDHFSAVGELVAGYMVREVLTSPQFAAHARGNPPAEDLLADLARLEHPPRLLSPGEQIPLATDTSLEVLWPPKDSAGLEANDASLVVRLTHAGRSILFTGDIQEDAMRALLNDPGRLKADVLVAPHHGSSEPSTDAFVAAVGPLYILSSNDRTLSRKQRDFDEIVAEQGGRTLYRTHRRGAIEVIIGRDGELRVEPFLDEKGQPRR